MAANIARTGIRKPRQQDNSIAGRKGGMYKAGGKDVPDARKTQNEANNKHIPVVIVDKLQTPEFAEVVVKATDPETGHHAPGVVHHDFAVVQQLKALQMLEKEVEGKDIYFRNKPITVFKDLSEPFTPEGNPNLTPLGFLKLLTEMANFKNFSLRDATTKATRIAQLKILNKEWRDKEEVKAERDEEKAVKQTISDERKSNQRANPEDKLQENVNDIVNQEIGKKQRTRTTNTQKDKAPKGHENAVDASVTKKTPKDEGKSTTKGGVDVHDMVPYKRALGIAPVLTQWIDSYDEDKKPDKTKIMKKSMDLLGTGGITQDQLKQIKKALGILN